MDACSPKYECHCRAVGLAVAASIAAELEPITTNHGMSLDAVKFMGVSPVHRAGENVTFQLQFDRDFLPQQDDRVFLLPVCWKTLEERRSTVQTTGGSTLTFCTSDLERGNASETFQFVYVQKNTAVGVSCPFDLRYTSEEDQEESISEDSEYHHVLGTNSLPSKGSLQSESNESAEKRTEGLAKPRNAKECTFEETGHRGGENVLRSSLEKMVPPSPPSARLTCRRLQSSDSGQCDQSFTILTMPSLQAKSENDRELEAQLARTVQEKDKVEKLYEREKAICAEQEKRNEELQKKHDRSLKENRKMKEELKRLESDVKQLTSISRRVENCSDKTVVSADCDQNQPILCNKESCSETPVHQNERSSLKPSLLDRFECPVCWEKFAKGDGAVNFQCHVHDHFSDDDHLQD